MQILDNFFSGTENLFKLLFINGLLLILLGLFYPLQKKDEIDLKIVEYNNQVRLLNKEISFIYKKTNELDTIIDGYENKIQNYLKLKKKSSPALKIQIDKSISDIESFEDKLVKESELKLFDVEKKAVEVENSKFLIKKLNSHYKVYNFYCIFCMVFGSILMIVGLVFWSRMTQFSYDKEYKDYRQRNPPNNSIVVNKLKYRIFKFILGILFFTIIAFIIVKIFNE